MNRLRLDGSPCCDGDRRKIKYNVFKVSDGSMATDCLVLRHGRDPIIRWVGKPDGKPLAAEAGGNK